MSFTDLGLSPKVLSGIQSAGYETPTPIQEQAIPFALEGRDVLGIAQTGTGKTGAFVLPMLTRLERGRARARMPRSLILEPTRELAAQVVESFESLGVNHKLTVALLIGGVSFDEQDRKLDRGADVVIATPGRLLDHFGRGKLLLTGVEILVIDEADRMLDMGFIPDIERISKLIPPRRQTLFFSATMPSEIQRLADTFLRSPERIEASPPSSTSANIDQRLQFISGDSKEKRAALRELIKGQDVKNAIVFCNRKRDVAVLDRSLRKHGFNAAALHGDMDQHQRMATLEAFRNGEVTFLAASDVAARGLDIPAVSHIFNFDVPIHAEDYVHRIGRTGRAGLKGFAVTLVTSGDLQALKSIESLVKRDIEWIGEPPSEEALAEGRGRGRGRRPAGRGRKEGGSRKGSSKQADAKPASAGKAEPSGEKKVSSEKKAKPQPAKSEAAEASRPSPAAADEDKNSRTRRRRGSRSGGGAESSDRADRKDSKAVQGMGDHVPDFMKKPVRTTAD